MTDPFNETSRNSCWRAPSAGRKRLFLVAAITLGAFASGLGIGFAGGSALGLGSGASAALVDEGGADGLLPDSSVQPYGHASWDSRPLRAGDDLPLADMRWLPPIEQLEMVDALPRGNFLSEAQVQGLRQVIMDGQVIEVVRNNAANRLIHRADDGELWRFFAGMHNDSEESAVWRDYSLQFLSLSVPFAADQATAMAALAEVATETSETFAGTALLHLARLGEAGVSVPPQLVTTVIQQRLGQSDTPDALRHTCLALIGEGRHHDLLPLARAELARTDAGPEALRGALYSLGRLGGEADRLAVESYLSHAHPGVVLAAQAAVARLDAGAANAKPSEKGAAIPADMPALSTVPEGDRS